ncbi:VRR-NUC domain-containing protein [Oceanobacter mangrovi]|uniref:VRR-NUC domain-containing protein n=1 Tax=Oceanobacter mangrovi TaxID=2862510 RepID=UPI001C8D5012|nr:VRR-NUC domain-containing protein [Oceanobacter mangrovi]
MSLSDNDLPESARTTAANPDLPPFYYLDNFDQLLAQVLERYHDLLLADELVLLTALMVLPANSRGWFVRLHSRKGRLFRLDRLQYKELHSLSAAMVELAQAGLIRLHPQGQQLLLPVADWSGLFNKSEWLVLLRQGELDLPSELARWKRPQLDEWLQQQAELPLLPTTIAELADPIEALLRLLRLLYFGNLNQSLTDFVLSDLGVYRYEKVLLDAETRLFESRDQVLAHLNYYDCLPELDDWPKQLDSEQLLALADSLPVLDNDPVLQRRVGRQWLKIARQLERLGEDQQALALYRRVELVPSRERQIRLLATTAPAEALELCRQIAVAPFNDEESRFLEGFLPRLLKKQQQPAPDWFMPLPAWQEQRQELVEADEQLLVAGQNIEAVALQRLLQQRGGSGFYVENALFSSLFGLLFWDVIYAPVKGAFYHPFQLRPDDLYDENFAVIRAQRIAEVFDSLQSGDWQRQVLQRLEQKWATANPFVYWTFMAEALASGCLQLAFERIPALHWQQIFERMLGDLKRRKTGLPDLVWFGEEDGYELIEVKGPGDTLQPNQKSWLGFFRQQGVPARVWYLVRSTGRPYQFHQNG